MYFSEPGAHAVRLFIFSNILLLQMLRAEKVFSVMFDVSCLNAPSNICDLFAKVNSKHKHETRFSSSGNSILCPDFQTESKTVLELNFET